MSAGLATVSGWELFESLRRMRQSFVVEHERLFRRHGDRIWLGWPASHFLLFRPEDVQHVVKTHASRYRKSRSYQALAPLLGAGLVLAEGDTWRQHRKLVAREFTPARVRDHVGTVVAHTERWLTSLRSGGTLRLDGAVGTLVFEIAADVLFGSTGSSVAQEVGRALSSYLEAFVAQAYSVLKAPSWLPTPSRQRMKEDVRLLDSAVDRVVSRARELGAAEMNVLGRLLSAGEASDERLDRRALRDEMVTLLMAGHETTANALLWTLHLLAENPECGARAYEEVHGVLRGAAPTAETLERLEYVEMCCLESMRLFPPVPGFSRDALEPDDLGGLAVKAGTRVEVSAWVTHRHPEFWASPAAFDPTRFAAGWRRRIVPFAYFPFSGGPRNCIGEELAKVELVAIVAMIVQTFELFPVGAPPIPFPSVTLRPWPELRLRLKRR